MNMKFEVKQEYPGAGGRVNGRQNGVRSGLSSKYQNFENASDARLAKILAARCIKNSAIHMWHLRRHQLRLATEYALDKIRDDPTLADWAIKKHLPIRTDYCLMGPNTIPPPFYPDQDEFDDEGFTIPDQSQVRKSPNIRNFFYVDIAVEFGTNKYKDDQGEDVVEMFGREEDDVITFLREDFIEIFKEKLGKYYVDLSVGQKNVYPDWALGDYAQKLQTHYRESNPHCNLEEKGEDKYLCLTAKSRRDMLRRGWLGMYRANTNIPNGVVIIHLDKYVVLDHKQKDIGMDAFGIRIWPMKAEKFDAEGQRISIKQQAKENAIVKGEHAEDKTTVVKEPEDIIDICSRLTRDEICRQKIIDPCYDSKDMRINDYATPTFCPEDKFGFDADFWQRRGRYALMSKFVLIWKWLRHQYNDHLACLTDWFIITLAFECCMKEHNKTLIKDRQINLGSLLDGSGGKNAEEFGPYKVTLSQAISESIELLAGIGLIRHHSRLISDPVLYDAEAKYRSILDELDHCQLLELSDYKEDQDMDQDEISQTPEIRSRSTPKTVRTICQVFRNMLKFSGTDDESVDDENQPEYQIFGRVEVKLNKAKKESQQIDWKDENEKEQGICNSFANRYGMSKEELEAAMYMSYSVIPEDAVSTQLSRELLKRKYANPETEMDDGSRTTKHDPLIINGMPVYLDDESDAENEEDWSD